MKVKFSCFKSLLKHSEGFQSETEQFLSEIQTRLGAEITETDWTDYDCDVKLLFVQTGGSEGLFLQKLHLLQPPFYLLTNGGNNSLAASLEILTYARLNGYEGEILHGDSGYIANRIKELALLATVKKQLSSLNIGVFGTPSDWLISSLPEEKTLLERLGVKLKFLPLSVAEKGIDTTDTFGDEQKEKQKAEQIYENLKQAVEQHNLQGLTLRCFDLLSSVKMTGCWALAKLNAEGITSACEGDIMAAVSMCLVKALFNQSSFQANPSRIDVANNEIVFAHCTAPLDMFCSYKLDTHFESGIGIALKGQMKCTDVTVFRLSSNLRDYSVLQGEIVENLNESNLCRMQIRVKMNDDVTTLLKRPCGNHHIIFYGHKKDELTQVLKLLLV